MPAATFAVSPILWTLETFEDFEKGKPDGAAVAAGGELVLAPGLKPPKIAALEQSSEPFLLSQTVGGEGTLFVGGGKRGQNYRHPPGAPGSLYFETRGLAVA